MRFLKQLDDISTRVNRMRIPNELKEEIRLLTQYLRLQVQCDYDRRDRQQNITEAVNKYTRKLYETALLSTFDQPEEFWLTLDRLSGKLNRTRLKIVKEPPPGSEKWDYMDLFSFLITETRKRAPSEDRERCLNGLIVLTEQGKKPRYSREQKRIGVIWKKEIHPYLNKNGMLEPFRTNLILKSRLQFYLSSL